MKILKLTEELAHQIINEERRVLEGACYSRDFTTREELTEYMNGSEESTDIGIFEISINYKTCLMIKIDNGRVVSYEFSTTEKKQAFLLGFQDRFYGKAWIIYEEKDEEFSIINKVVHENNMVIFDHFNSE